MEFLADCVMSFDPSHCSVISLRTVQIDGFWPGEKDLRGSTIYDDRTLDSRYLLWLQVEKIRSSAWLPGN